MISGLQVDKRILINRSEAYHHKFKPIWNKSVHELLAWKEEKVPLGIEPSPPHGHAVKSQPPK